MSEDDEKTERFKIRKTALVCIKETPRRRIKVTSFVKRNIHGSYVKCGREGSRHYSAHPTSYYKQVSGQIYKDDVNGFSSTLNISFMLVLHSIR
jgi:hypothetical protein